MPQPVDRMAGAGARPRLVQRLRWLNITPKRQIGF